MSRALGHVLAVGMFLSLGCGSGGFYVPWDEVTSVPETDTDTGAFDPPNVTVNPGSDMWPEAPGDPNVLFFADFEESDGNMVVLSPGSWAWGVPTSGPGAAYSGARVWATGLANNYPPGDATCLGTPLIELPADPPAQLRYHRWIDTEGGFDEHHLRIEADGILSNSIVVESGNNNAYQPLSLNLIQFRGQQVRIQFCLFADGSIEEDGVFLDDVLVHLL